VYRLGSYFISELIATFSVKVVILGIIPIKLSPLCNSDPAILPQVPQMNKESTIRHQYDPLPVSNILCTYSNFSELPCYSSPPKNAQEYILFIETELMCSHSLPKRALDIKCRMNLDLTIGTT